MSTPTIRKQEKIILRMNTTVKFLEGEKIKSLADSLSLNPASIKNYIKQTVKRYLLKYGDSAEFSSLLSTEEFRMLMDICKLKDLIKEEESTLEYLNGNSKPSYYDSLVAFEAGKISRNPMGPITKNTHPYLYSRVMHGTMQFEVETTTDYKHITVISNHYESYAEIKNRGSREDRILEIRKENENFVIEEGCDSHYSSTQSKQETIELLKELIHFVENA